MARLLLCLAVLVALPMAAAPAGDHCDIALLPAATLLLPYFEVNAVDHIDADTRFTIVNTTDAERVAHVTLWTDRAYPVLGFNVALTGYDMATIDLYDVPLPSTFAAPWSTRDGGATLYNIWREGPAGQRDCGEYRDAERPYVSIVRFDESENAVSDIPQGGSFEGPRTLPTLASTSRTSVADASVYPQLTNGARNGWMYFNLDDPGEKFAVQAWISTNRITPGSSSQRGDAAALGNGCSPRIPKKESPQ